jgi:L-lysine exporter family protein LysE/ArgO
MEGLVPVAQGFGVMLSLIVAIGAQNTFLLRQGLLRSHVTPLVLICWISDVILVLVGVSGVGAVIERLPLAMTVIKIAGAAVLLGYAALAIRRTVRGESLDLADPSNGKGLTSTVLTCLAITWLNPQVYLDTVLMIGAVANSHAGSARWWFTLGTLIGSIAWFTALGYGAALLRPLFRRTLAWRILDSAIAAVMITMAVRLLVL